MKKYTGYIAYSCFWLAYFIFSKALFLLYHHAQTASLTTSEIFKVFIYGLRMDVSFSAYLCIFPFLLFFLRTIFINLAVSKAIRIYTVSLVILLSFITTADLELYNAWGYRMDATPLLYIVTPKEMASSVAAAPLFLLLVIFILFSLLFIWLYNRYFHRYTQFQPRRFSLVFVAVSLFLIAFLFVPIRGGIQKIPMNQSDVYFSEKLFADHAAINLPWNVIFSILNKNNNKNPFDYFSNKEAAQLVASLYHTGPKKIPSILKQNRPNIIFIIMESFTAKFVGDLGGKPGVTPNLDKIAADGLLFTNIYAAGDRSEKGLLAILSGYPNQAITSIIKTPTKTEKLSQIAKSLETAGYNTSYTYGGELEFANIKSYLINAGFDTLTSKYSFPVSERTTSWGVHDQFVLDDFYERISRKPQPFFATLFTLSSHEPFDVPMAPRFPGKDETTLFKNSVAYTDSVLGVFISRIKRDSVWSNTLIVLVADHGHPLPGHDRNDAPSKFRIPLIFTGGALKMKGIISTIGSQTDITKTVLDQVGISSAPFSWSKDLLDSSAHPFAFYCFNNGFGFVTPSATTTVDNVSGKVIYTNNPGDSASVNFGKAYMQLSYEDYLKR